jgi:hypothetical protein
MLLEMFLLSIFFFEIKTGALSFNKKEKQSYNLSLQRPKHRNKPSRETKR